MPNRCFRCENVEEELAGGGNPKNFACCDIRTAVAPDPTWRLACLMHWLSREIKAKL